MHKKGRDENHDPFSRLALWLEATGFMGSG